MEQDRKSAKKIITKPWLKPNWKPETTENIVPGKIGTKMLTDLSKNKKNINIGFIINYRLDGWLCVTNYYLNLFNTL